MSDKKVKWTGIDTLIVLIVIAVIAVAGVMFGPSMFDKSEKQNIEFTVMLQAKEQELADAMKPGAKATLSLTEKDGGVIKEVRSEEATQMTYNSIDGTYENIPLEGKVDIYVTIEADCDVNETTMKTGDTAIRVGADIPVRGKGFATSGFIIEIND